VNSFLLSSSALSSFEGMKFLKFYKSGGDSEKVTPVPIPNTEVKLLSADGSWGLSPCESRTLPGKNKKQLMKLFFCFAREHF
jgi:hypothetical protein